MNETCDSKKSRVIKEQEASRLFGKLGFQKSLYRISVLGNISF